VLIELPSHVEIELSNWFTASFSPLAIAAFVFDPPGFAARIGDDRHTSTAVIDCRVLEHEFDSCFGRLVTTAISCKTWVVIGISE